jgi:CRP/FNR family transcriptional regulator, cyclic AMP receptor protein
MRKVLYILGQFDDTDIDWLARQGRRQVLAPGTMLISQGEPTPDLYIVIDGLLDVSVAGIGSVARLQSGEIIGEMSFVDSAPPSASVSVLANSILLAICKEDIEARVADDALFGYRFYKALALFLADRLRNAQKPRKADGAPASLSDDEAGVDEIDEKLLDTISIAGDRFDRLVKAVDAKRV